MQEIFLGKGGTLLLHAVGPFALCVAKRLCESWPRSVIYESADLSFPSDEVEISSKPALIVVIADELPSAHLALEYTSALADRGLDLIALLKDRNSFLLGPFTSGRNFSCCWSCVVRRLQQHHLAEREAESVSSARHAAPSVDGSDACVASWLNWALHQEDSRFRGQVLILNMRPFSMTCEIPIGFDGCPICDQTVTAGGRTTSTLLSELQWLWAPIPVAAETGQVIPQGSPEREI